jgi:hypothetical protein
MKDKIEVMDRYFNSFINKQNEYHFFLDLYDYLKYIDTVPEIEKVIAKLPAIRQELLRMFMT